MMEGRIHDDPSIIAQMDPRAHPYSAADVRCVRTR
jgi:hypothetical protein